jgi:hypothetical protein
MLLKRYEEGYCLFPRIRLFPNTVTPLRAEARQNRLRAVLFQKTIEPILEEAASYSQAACHYFHYTITA